MTKRPSGTRAAPKAEPKPVEQEPNADDVAPSVAITQRGGEYAHSAEEAEARYVAARDAWTEAMRASGSGRPADLAALAVAQEAYEQALAEQERWASGAALTPIPVQEDRPRALNDIVQQEMARRRVQELDSDAQPPKGIRGFFRRRRGK